MKKSFVSILLSILGFFQPVSNGLNAEEWMPDERAARFTLKPDQAFGTPFFDEALETYGPIGFAYADFMGDHNLRALQEELGVRFDEASEVSVVMGNFLETLCNLPVSTSGNYEVFNGLPLTVILRAKSEVSPDTFFEKFDRWASGLFYEAHMIKRFREGGRIPSDKIDEMSRMPRVERELYLEMKKSEKVGRATLFAIPAALLNQAWQRLDSQKISMGMQAENGSTVFAFGAKDAVLDFFDHQEKAALSNKDVPNADFASFRVPFDAEFLKQLEKGRLSDPNGPLGPLATTLGEAAYQIREISGSARISEGRAHFDLTVRCSDSESAQAIWSVAQASLGMAQLRAIRQQMKNPQAVSLLPMSFLNKIKVKHEGMEASVHFEALPAELFPWAANKKFP